MNTTRLNDMSAGEDSSSVLDLAYRPTAYNRKDGRAEAEVSRLHDALFRVASSMEAPLIEGEEGGIGPTALNRALSDLSDGPSRPLACLMLAKIVTDAVAASHELITREPVSIDVRADLLNRLIAFGGYPGWNDPLPVVGA